MVSRLKNNTSMNQLLHFFVKNKKNQLLTSEQEEYAKFLEATGKDELGSLDKIWSLTGTYKKNAHAPDEVKAWNRLQAEIEASQSSQRIVPLRRTGIRIAASIGLVVSVFFLLKNYTPILGGGKTVYVENSTTQELVHHAPDGSLIRLQPGARIAYAKKLASQAKREINLEGSAFFVVTSLPARSFVVHHQGTDVEVLGTRFLIQEQTLPEHLATIVEVEEGKVAFWESGSQDTLILTQAERGICVLGDKMKKEAFDLSQGNLPKHIVKSRGWALAEVQSAFFAWTGVDLRISSSVSSCSVTGNLDVSSPYRLKNSLEDLGYEVTLSSAGNLLVGSSQGCPGVSE